MKGVESMILSLEQINNIENLLQTHLQYKHINKAIEQFGLNRNNKSGFIDELLEKVTLGNIPLKEFYDWLTIHQIDGNNYFFVFELNEHDITPELLSNLETNSDRLSKNIADINIENLTDTELTAIRFNQEDLRAVFTYISPASIIRREKDGNNTIAITEIVTYWSHVIVDLKKQQITVVINPTANLVAVRGIEKNRRTYFEPIANHYLSELQKNLNFTIKKSDWVDEALYLLAEEGTYHNNPRINIELNKYSKRLDSFAEEMLIDAQILDQASLEYFQDEMKQVFENLLIDKYGVISTEDQFRVFKQVGDNTDTVVYVSSRTSNLQEGRAAKVAKATRTLSDVSILGVEREKDGKIYRLLISKQTDGFLVKNLTSRFTEEVVISDVISKINTYRGKIQSDSRDIAASGTIFADIEEARHNNGTTIIQESSN